MRQNVKPTQKPVPSSDIKDLFFNSGLLDIWATSLERKYIDRFGNCHLTAAGMEWLFKELVEKFKVDMNTAIVAAGYITVDSFQQGADLPNNELTQRNHILRDETTGEYYRWDGDLPKQVLAGSTPESTGGIGKGAWVSVGDASLRSELASDGDALIGVKQPYDGSVARTQHDFNAQFVSVKDFGDSFKQAHISSPASKWVLVPSGDYKILSDIDCTGRVFIFEEPVNIIGVGKLLGAVIHRHHPDGSVSYGVGEVQQYKSKYRFGSSGHGPLGLQIGGAEPADGVTGNVIFPEDNGSWTTMQPAEFGSSIELSVQPSSITGILRTIAGTNRVEWVSGEKFTPTMLLSRIYWAGLTYRVSVYVSDTVMHVTEVNGTGVSFLTTEEKSYQTTNVIMSGVGFVSGDTLTRISGDPLVRTDKYEYAVFINGKPYRAAALPENNSIKLLTSPSEQGEVSYLIKTTVDDIASVLRLQKVSGAGFEENLTLGAYASGKFQIHAGSSGGQEYPLVIGCQWDTDGEERSSVYITPDGQTKIGGKLGGSLVVPYNENPASAFIMIEGNAFGEVYLRASSPGDNANVYIIPKGDGHVSFGRVTQGGGTISSYIEIKDATGVIRKLAVID